MQRLRDAIDQWHLNKTYKPLYLGQVKAWALPSRSSSIHRIIIHHPKRGWACSCEGYYFGNECGHIGEIKKRLKRRKRGR